MIFIPEGLQHIYSNNDLPATKFNKIQILLYRVVKYEGNMLRTDNELSVLYKTYLKYDQISRTLIYFHKSSINYNENQG